MSLHAGVATRDLTPRQPVFLAGYPHLPRTSTGVHDKLSASALFLSDGTTPLLLIGVDILFISSHSTEFCRSQIGARTGVPAANILISATHTHSAPLTAELLAWKDDPVVPPPDPDYMEHFHRAISEAGIAAWAAHEPARLAITTAVAKGVGGNRVDPNGPADAEACLLVVQRSLDQRLLALDLVFSLHPTVLHEDSRLVSSDFPHFTRRHIGEAFAGLTTIYHTGPCGDLSPRYFITEHTFAEAERLGRSLGEAAVGAVRSLAQADFRADLPLACVSRPAELVPNTFPPIAEAQAALRQARERYEQLKRQGASRPVARTAECAVFGCEEALTLARAQASGETARWQKMHRAEVQVFRIGDLFLVALPGEQFAQYGLELKRRAPRRCFVISLANGELQGYIVTPEAALRGGYETAFALFRPETGGRMVEAAMDLMQGLLYDPGD